jgi:hypothetical protein
VGHVMSILDSGSFLHVIFDLPLTYRPTVSQSHSTAYSSHLFNCISIHYSLLMGFVSVLDSVCIS